MNVSRRLSVRLSTGDIVVFALAAGLVSTFAHGYLYGLANHVEHLPRIFRAMDPSYLANDFTVNATSGYEPRFYYTWLMALLGRIAPLPAVFLVLTVLQNAAMAAVTLFVGRRLFKSDAAALAGAALVMSVNATNLGGAGFLFTSCLLPSSFVTPLALFALWQGIENRPSVCAVLAAVAALIQPLVGLELGAIGLASAFLSVLLRIEPAARPASMTRKLLPIVASGLGLALFAFVVWLRPQDQVLSNSRFVELYGWLRAPHHIIPSQFRRQDFASFALLLAASGAAWFWWRRSIGADENVAWRIVVPVAIVLVLFACGYVFVELVPLRTVATLQFFRLALIPKWLGLMLLGNAAALTVRRYRESRLTALARLLLLAGLLVCFIWPAPGSSAEAFTLAAIGLTVLAVLLVRYVAFRWTSVAAVAGATVALTLAGGSGLPLARPVFTIAQGNGRADRVAEFARVHTPVDAVFVTPPLRGRFRLVARRAIVVDFKNFVFSDEAMMQWLERLVDCYGEPEGHGFYAAYAMEHRYRSVAETRLLRLREKYGATHAVLFANTPCRFPLLYADDRYKLVTIPEMAPD